jgi:hypothetical protein
MKLSIVAAVAGCAVCFLLMGCETPRTAGGEKVVSERADAPTGTFIPRKKGTGVGATQVGTLDKQDLENQRNMNSANKGL